MVQWRKVKQMRPIWLCLFLGKQFEDTFVNSQWSKCNQCDFASSRAGNLRTHMLYHNPEKYRYFIFKNPGIGIWVQSRYTGIFRYTAGACPWHKLKFCQLILQLWAQNIKINNVEKKGLMVTSIWERKASSWPTWDMMRWWFWVVDGFDFDCEDVNI